MGNWYIDRSRNLSEDTKWIKSLIFSIDRIDPNNVGLKSNDLIELLPDILKKGKNPFAVLTYLRDIGFINLDNKLGENSKLLLDDKLTYWELVFELLFKRFHSKEQFNSTNPLVILITTLYEIYDYNRDKSTFITWNECSDYLFKIDDYQLIDRDLVIEIIKNREKNIKGNNYSVLDIWFNSLKNLPIFYKDDIKDRLTINLEYLDFYKLIHSKSQNIRISEIKIYNRKGLYDYYGNSNNGIINFIPNINKDFILNNKSNIEGVYNHLFGIEVINDEIYLDYFGLYKPFRWCPNLALRKIQNLDYEFGDKIIAFSMNNSFEKYENKLFRKISVEYKKLQSKEITKELFDKHINELMEYDLSVQNEEFNIKVIMEFNAKCAICDESYLPILEVIRIKSFCEDFNINEAFDTNNALLLCPTHKKLFEEGIISYNLSGFLEVNEEFENSNFEIKKHIGQYLNVFYLNNLRRKYLGFHNTHKYIKGK